MRRLLVIGLVGAIVGAIVASLVVPPWLAWYNEPGNISGGKSVQTLCNVPELVHYTARRLIAGQIIGSAVGAALFAVVGAWFGHGEANSQVS
jgi:hypothetical protein